MYLKVYITTKYMYQKVYATTKFMYHKLYVSIKVYVYVTKKYVYQKVYVSHNFFLYFRNPLFFFLYINFANCTIHRNTENHTITKTELISQKQNRNTNNNYQIGKQTLN